MKIKSVYLDVCALCRPFDDQSFVRVHMESEAVKLILQKVKTGNLQLCLSPVHYQEISAITDTIERSELVSVIDILGQQIKTNQLAARQRADFLVNLGFGIADAAHLAFAEAAKADFVTCDDKLLRKYLKTSTSIWYGDPMQFCSKENLK